MSARETMVILKLPWGTTKSDRLPSKRAARARADELVGLYRKHLALGVTEDSDGDLIVQEVEHA